MNGAELLRRSLLREGVEVVFGHPGGAILPFYDALHGQSAPRHVLMRHEQGAAHAADGYARATGRVGVCVATSGPGATNLVTGLATALMDSVPMVAITGQVPRGALGTDAFQETDVLGVTMPVTKHGYLVEEAEEIPSIVAEAFRLAIEGRPGPVLIDVPKDVQAAEVAEWATAEVDVPRERRDAPARPAPLGPAPGSPSRKADRTWTSADIERAADLLAEAERPVVMAGRGVVLSRNRETLIRLAERADLPVITTLLGLDAFPAKHRCALGMPGMHGTERANRSIQEADLVLGLGLRFDDRVTGRLSDFAPRARIVHFEVDPAVVGRTVRVDHPVVGDLAETLPPFVEQVEPASREEWWQRLREWSRVAAPEEDAPDPATSSGAPSESTAAELDPSTGRSYDPTPLSARTAIRHLARWIGAHGAVVATDVGQHQMWFAQELEEAEPGTHLTSGGLGTMGYSLPAALGAAVARPGHEVWAVTGDGGFQMTSQELATAVQERLPLRIAVINNGSLGMVRQWQELVYDGRFVASTLSGPDFVLLGRAFGIPACGVTTEAELVRALERSPQLRGPILLDIRVPAEEKVYPMIPAGAALHEMVFGPPPAARVI